MVLAALRPLPVQLLEQQASALVAVPVVGLGRFVVGLEVDHLHSEVGVRSDVDHLHHGDLADSSHLHKWGNGKAVRVEDERRLS